MGLKKAIVGSVIVLAIGGTTYSVNKTDVVNNLAKDTGMNTQQAEEYVISLKEDDMATYDVIGNDFIKDGNEVVQGLGTIDCDNYRYEWETPTLSCEHGKSQLAEMGRDEIALGNAYIKIASSSVTKADIQNAVSLIDEVNSDYSLEIVAAVLDQPTIQDSKKVNSFNKATLQAALQNN